MRSFSKRYSENDPVKGAVSPDWDRMVRDVITVEVEATNKLLRRIRELTTTSPDEA